MSNASDLSFRNAGLQVGRSALFFALFHLVRPRVSRCRFVREESDRIPLS